MHKPQDYFIMVLNANVFLERCIKDDLGSFINGLNSVLCHIDCSSSILSESCRWIQKQYINFIYFLKTKYIKLRWYPQWKTPKWCLDAFHLAWEVYGIGSFSQAAYDFVDFLVRTKQRYWQILPLGTTSGDSHLPILLGFCKATPILLTLIF